MTSAIQKLYYIIGSGGCYFLCLVKIAEKITGRTYDPVAVYADMTAAGYMDDQCYMIAPHKVLSTLTGIDFAVSKQGADYRTKDGEYEILHYQNGSTGHFVLGDGHGNTIWDPYGKSRTVQEGKIDGKRIFTAEAVI